MERIRSNRQQQQQQQRFCRRLALVGSRRRVFLVLLVLLAWCGRWSSTTVVEAKRKTPPETITPRQKSLQPELQETDPITGVPFLVEMLGKELYSYLDRPKYRLYLRMTVGKLPNEETFVVTLNMICNLLYGVAILVGFLLLPRGFMLLGTLATIFVGPALVLILLGSTALVAVAFALYPVTSVLTLWLFFFSTSQAFQVIGRQLGLDRDGDGDVDLLDVLHCASQTTWGRALGLPKLHETLNQATMDPFQEIKQRLDAIQNSTRALETTTINATGANDDNKKNKNGSSHRGKAAE